MSWNYRKNILTGHPTHGYGIEIDINNHLQQVYHLIHVSLDTQHRKKFKGLNLLPRIPRNRRNAERVTHIGKDEDGSVDTPVRLCQFPVSRILLP